MAFEQKSVSLDEFMDTKGLKCRGDKVLFKRLARDKMGGLVMPQNSAEGSEFVIVAISNKVEELKDLRVGDSVLIQGQQNVHWAFVPGYPEIAVTDHSNVSLVLRNLYDDAQNNPPKDVSVTAADIDNDVPSFDESAYPDADLSSNAPELMANARAAAQEQEPATGEDTLTIHVNGDPMSVVVLPGETEEQILGKVNALCQLKYGNGKLHTMNKPGSYHWRTR